MFGPKCFLIVTNKYFVRVVSFSRFAIILMRRGELVVLL